MGALSGCADTVPPPMSYRTAQYFKSHPAAYQEFLAQLPHRSAARAATAPAVSPNFGGSAIVMCYSGAPSHNACTFTTPTSAVLQEVGGTSAASPFMAGVMALVLQKTGARQGLANPAFYKLDTALNGIKKPYFMYGENSRLCVNFGSRTTTPYPAQTKIANIVRPTDS